MAASRPDWKARRDTYLQNTFAHAPLVTLSRGQGARVYSTDGHEYIDLVAGIAVNVLGHCHPAVVDAIRRQSGELIHISNLYLNERQIVLAEELFSLSGMRSFFSNSGAEANEGAIKLARKYGKQHRDGAYEIISMVGSFHGRTLATTSATGQKKYQDSWVPLADGFRQVPFNDLDAVKQATTPKTAGILVEPIQGEGGIYPTTCEYWSGLRQWCDEQDLVLIADEVQAGMGRTGKFFSWEHFGPKPDIITMAKGLAGGVPIGGMLAAPRVDLFEPGDHGSTFGGNPLACAAAVATIRTIKDEDLLSHATAMGAYLNSRLGDLQDKYAFITDLRGLGLMQAFDVDHDRASAVVQAAFDRGVLVGKAGTSTIRFIPPLIISKADIDEAVEILDAALGSL